MNIAALMRHFSIRTRMRGAIAMVLTLFALVGAIGISGGWLLRKLNQEFMTHSIAEMKSATNVRFELASVRHHEQNMLIDYDQADALDKHRAAWLASLAATRASLDALLAGEEDEDNALAREAIASLDAYRQASERVVEQIRKGAYDNPRAANRQLDRAKEKVREVEQRVARIVDVVEAEAASTQAEFTQLMDRVFVAFVGVLILVLVIVVPLTLLNSYSITQPIEYASQVAQSIARGDLSKTIRVEGRDEAARMLDALRTMQGALTGMVSQLRDSSHSIRQASTEVAQGNNDLSQRTEHSASSLQQTASSITELTRHVGQSADSAATANQLAAQAAGVAQQGGQVVAQVVATMDDIRTSSHRIADITSVIDGIAFQTNILALNAAVEAARAGEQGRGFAVVAGEVRSLAQRSAEAAREIKSLIGSSVERVEAGSRLVKDAGTTMEQIVSAVERVSQVIGEISDAAREQTGGIAQVNSAVSQLDRMTQQNAALVEQSAAAAESLKSQASRLNEVVDTFHLEPA